MPPQFVLETELAKKRKAPFYELLLFNPQLLFNSTTWMFLGYKLDRDNTIFTKLAKGSHLLASHLRWMITIFSSEPNSV